MSRSEIESAVAVANVPALLMLVFQASGDSRWLEDPYRPAKARGLEDHDSGGLPIEVQTAIREAAVESIVAMQSGEGPAISVPSPKLMVRMMRVYTAENVGDEYGPMLSTEFARLIGAYPDKAAQEGPKPPSGFSAIIVGAGVAGITAAQQFEEMGVEYTVLEARPKAGGTWLQNTYPGAGVDTPSHLYSFSFARNDWAKHFELRDAIQDYLSHVLEQIGAKKRVRFGTEVLSAVYDEGLRSWCVHVQNADGSRETLGSSVVISAVGVLNRPKFPNIEGLDRFDGEMFHSAEWPSDVDLRGKRVSIVGTGASSMQIVPAIADSVEKLNIFQRSPQWVAPFGKFQQKIPLEVRALLKECPLYHGWYWLRLFWQFGDRVLDALRKDPHWEHPDRSVNARNDAHRKYFTRYMEEQLKGRPDLFEKALPDYPPFGKRILLDNGWYSALRRDNVELIDESVSALRERSVVTNSGEEHETDLVILATGFDAVRFVASLDVRGIGGRSLREAWDDDDPRAFLGISTPEFPNFFMLGGPNSFPGSGSFMFFMELQMRYIRDLLERMFEREIAAVDAREDVSRKYNQLVDSTHEKTVWTHPGMDTYYRNSRGRVVFVMPFRNVDYWQMVAAADLDDYNVR